MPGVAAQTDILMIHTPEVEIGFSCEDGGLRVLQRAGGPNVLGYGVALPSVDVRLSDGPWLAERSFVRYLGHRHEQRGDAHSIELMIGLGPLKLHDTYLITGTLIARSLRVENVSEDARQLRGVRLSLPWVRIGATESCRFESPGASVRPRIGLSVAAAQRLAVLPRRFFAPGLRENQAIEPAPLFSPGLMALHNPELEESLFCWYMSQVEPAQAQLEGNDLAVTLQHEVGLAGWLGEGEVLEAGSQYILLMREDWPVALEAFQRTWGLVTPQRSAPPETWVRDAALYEVHPALFGGFAGLAGALPALAELGIDTLCLMPIWPYDSGQGRLWDGNWGASGDVYAVADLEQLDPSLGSAEDMRALVASAHERSMRVIVDLPMLGCSPSSHYRHEHPDWFCSDEQGRLALDPGRAGLLAFDWGSAGLRAYMAERALSLLREFAIDGLRAITPRSALPSWSSARSPHASAGQMGHVALLAELRDAMAAEHPGAVLIGDLAGPVGAGLQAAALDELAHHMFVHTALGRLSPNELGEWLADHCGAMPAGGPRICFTESSRTRIINPLADGLRGSRISRMLLAGIVLCGFVPSIWSGQEQDEAATIARLLAIRREWPVLRTGELRLGAVPCNSTQVFTVLRSCGAGPVIGLLNVGPHRQTVTLSLPIDTLKLDDGDYALRELIAGRRWKEGGCTSWRRDELLALSLTLEPFGAYILALEKHAESSAA